MNTTLTEGPQVTRCERCGTTVDWTPLTPGAPIATWMASKSAGVRGVARCDGTGPKHTALGVTGPSTIDPWKEKAA